MADNNPSKIESKVLGTQEVRTPTKCCSSVNAKSSYSEDNKVEIYTNQDSYVPVIKITKHEAVFTKGDLKLQKVTVKEDISMSFQHLIKKQNLPGKTVVTENIYGCSPRVQKMRRVNQNEPSFQVYNDVIPKIKDEVPPTKIPGLVRQAVEKFKAKGPQPVDANTRRSSIPKLIPKTRTKSCSDDNYSKNTYKVSRKGGRSSIDATFDEIYDEVTIDSDKIDDKLNEIVTDIEDADTKFEIVANSYDDVAVPSLPIDKKISKIPIKRFTSQHEKSNSPNIDRRHSVHTNVVNNSIRKLSKKKINNIDNLDELLDDISQKNNIITQLKDDQTLLERMDVNVIETVPNHCPIEDPDDIYEEYDVTPTPNIKDNYEDYEFMNNVAPKIENNEAINNTLIKRHSIIQDEDQIKIELKVSSDFHQVNGDTPSPQIVEDITELSPKKLNRFIFRQHSILDSERKEARPILSKIAMFEKRSNSSPKLKPTTPPNSIHCIDLKVSKKEKVSNKETIQNIEPVIKIIENKNYDWKIGETNLEPKVKEMPSKEDNFKNKDSNNQNSIATFAEEIKLARKQLQEDTQFRKSKSTPNFDSGGALTYQKQRRFSRLTSVEKLVLKIERNNKACTIDVKELPRRKSVSEKIAMFEGRLSQPQNDTVSTKVVDSIKLKLLNNTSTSEINITTNEEEEGVVNSDLAAKIEELKNAKAKYGTISDTKYIELSNGVQMPVIALGTALLDPELTYHIVTAAIDLGYRAIDTAYIYGNEREIGTAIKHKIEDGTVTRGELFIINKLWSTFHRTDLVEVACRNSLQAMQLDYFDLYLIHNPMSFKEGPNPIPKIANVLQYSSFDYLDAWYGMEDLVVKNLAKSIGVSNFNSVQVLRILEKGKIAPVVNQVESHPFLSQLRLGSWCAGHRVVLQSYAVLGSGSRAVLDELLAHEPAHALIRFQLDMERAVVVKSSSAAHLWSNLQATTALVKKDDLRALLVMNRNKRMFNFKGLGDTHRNYPFNIPF